MSDLVYVQKHIFDLDCHRVYPILGYSETFVVANEATCGDGDYIEEWKGIEEMIARHDMFATSHLASAIAICKEQTKLWNTISELESKVPGTPTVPTHTVYKD